MKKSDSNQLNFDKSISKVVNVSTVPHRSPFRYPGGKTWFVPIIRQWLASMDKKPKEFCEPFAGGGIVGLTTVFESLADSLTMVELDEGISAVWDTIINGKAKELSNQIISFNVNRKSVESILNANNITPLQIAFATILRNRVQRGGIMAKGAGLMKSGENGKGLTCRWYPQTLKTRINNIHAIRSNITFIHGDGIDAIKQRAKKKTTVFFIDPPYTVAGRRLYSCSDIDHEKLFKVTQAVKGDFLMTYDKTEYISNLAKKYGFDMADIPMKNTHNIVMNELLIGRDLSWFRLNR